ncbi:MAG: hypothetical protein HRT68_04955 [Flavobacteriaceae bacterium]|nr:hypothetical protein [Flavobacteriaceae bacterium]
MKETLIKTLTKINIVLDSLSDTEYADKSVAPFYSSVGGHVRHILDFYDAILQGCESDCINLVARQRDEMTEKFTNVAIDRVNKIRVALTNLDENYNLTIPVIDNLGDGNVNVPYTLGGILSHANSHAIHHYAIISYILNTLGVAVKDTTFGYNPSTPKNVSVEN